MTRYYSRRNLPRTSHPSCTKRPSIRNNPFYYLRSLLLPRLFLSLLPLKPGPNSRIRGPLTPHRNLPTRPVWGAPPKHSCSPGLRSNCYLGSPQHYGRRTQTSHPVTSLNNPARLLLYPSPSHRILRSPLYNCRRRLWINILRSHWLPWITRHHRLHLPSSVSTTPDLISLHLRTSLRIWGSRLILTLRGRCLTILIYLHLLMRILTFLVQKI